MDKKRDFNKTEYQLEKERTELRIYEEYMKLTSDPKAYRGEVTKYLMEKYHIHSPGTIWNIRKRVEKRLGVENGED